MPRYTFDVGDDAPAEWGEPEPLGEGHDEIERRACELIFEAQKRQIARGSLDVLTTVFFHHEGNGIILTVFAKPGEDMRVVWAAV